MLANKFSTIQLHPFYINEGSTEYLVLKRNTFSHFYPGMWQVITGKIESEEIAYKAALRELNEETSLDYKILYHIPYIGSFYDWQNDKVENIPCFAVELNSKDVVLSNEHSQFEFVKFEKLGNFLELPSHLNASEHLKKCIIDNPNRNNFRIKL